MHQMTGNLSLLSQEAKRKIPTEAGNTIIKRPETKNVPQKKKKKCLLCPKSKLHKLLGKVTETRGHLDPTPNTEPRQYHPPPPKITCYLNLTARLDYKS